VTRWPVAGRRAAAVVTALLVLVGAACGGSSPSVGASVSVFHLKVGECLVPPTAVQAELASVKVVSCKEPHTQEVFHLVDDNTGNDTYPGDSALVTFAQGSCLEAFGPYVGVSYRNSQLYYTYLLPSVRSWADKDRTIVCVITTTGRPLKSSVKGTRM
jgi:Septum formation